MHIDTRTFILVGALVAACSETPIDVPPEEPLLPWPSSRYLQPSPETDTGFRVGLPDGDMPMNVDEILVAPEAWNAWDGFDPMSTMLVELSVRIDDAPLVGCDEIARSLADDSPTIIVDASTGERVAHFAEIEPAADPGRTTLYIRPAARLAEDRDYVVAMRGLTDESGAPVAPLPRFHALRDGIPTIDDALEASRAEVEARVFDPLAAAGVPRDELILAWDFHTASGRSAWGDLVAMRDDAFATVGDAGLGCRVTESIEGDGALGFARVVHGTFTVPSYLDEGGRLVRDAAGTPNRAGDIEVPFVAAIPFSVVDAMAAGDGPARVVAYGHGLFSDRTEALRDFMVDMTAVHPMVVVATDFTGLTEADMLDVASALTELSTFDSVIDTVAQSMIGQLLLPRTFVGACASDGALQIDGAFVGDPEQLYYYGNSQGAILGPALAALSPDVARWVLGVGGVSYPIMMPRSTHWPLIEAVLSAGYPDRADRDQLMVMFAHQWSRIEGAAFAPHVLGGALPGGSPARVLYQVAENDAQTPNVASDIAIRTMGLPLLESSSRPVWGVDTANAPVESAAVYFDLGARALDCEPVSPAEDTVAHEGLRNHPPAWAQIDAFLQPDGVVIDVATH